MMAQTPGHTATPLSTALPSERHPQAFSTSPFMSSLLKQLCVLVPNLTVGL